MTALEKAKGVWMEAQAVRKAKSRGKHGGYEDRECVCSEIFLGGLQLSGVIEKPHKGNCFVRLFIADPTRSQQC